MMQFPLPTWHHYMHNLECQRRNSFRTMVGAGLGCGEPNEILWSRLRKMGLLLQYVSLAFRDAALQRAAVLYNYEKRMDLPNLLGRMFYRAKLKRVDAQARIDTIEDECQRLVDETTDEDTKHGLLAKVEQMKTTPPSLEVDTLAGELEAAAEYVYLSKLSAGISSSETSQLHLLLDDPSSSKLKPGSAMAKKVASRLHDVKKTMNITTDWAPDDQRYRLAWLSWLAHRMRQQHGLVMQCQTQIGMMRVLFQKVKGRRTDVKKLTKMEGRENSRLHGALLKLHQLSEELLAAAEATSESSSTLEIAKKQGKAVLDVVPKVDDRIDLKPLESMVLKGEFPWLQASESGISPVERFRLPFHIALWEIERAQEEMELVHAEMFGVLEALSTELVAIEKAILSHREAIDSYHATFYHSESEAGGASAAAAGVAAAARAAAAHAAAAAAAAATAAADAAAHAATATADATTTAATVSEAASAAANAASAAAVAADAAAHAAAAADGGDDDAMCTEDGWKARCQQQESRRAAMRAESSIEFLSRKIEETRTLKAVASSWLARICVALEAADRSSNQQEEDELQEMVEAFVEIDNDEDNDGDINDEA